MLLKREEESGSIEAYFDSSNVLKSLYIKERNMLYVFFGKGNVYSYYNIDNELYNLFESAESQGEFLTNEIRTKSQKHPTIKEFKMKPFELNEITQKISILINEREDE